MLRKYKSISLSALRRGGPSSCGGIERVHTNPVGPAGAYVPKNNPLFSFILFLKFPQRLQKQNNIHTS